MNNNYDKYNQECNRAKDWPPRLILLELLGDIRNPSDLSLRDKGSEVMSALLIHSVHICWAPSGHQGRQRH